MRKGALNPGRRRTFPSIPRRSTKPHPSWRCADNAEVAILEDDESYSFDESGRSVHTQYVVYKVLNQKGAECMGRGFSGLGAVA